MSDTWRKHSVGALARAWWVIVGAWRPGRPGDWILREGILMFGPNVTLALQRNTLLWKHKPCKPLCHTTPLGTAAGEVIIGENYTLWIRHGMEIWTQGTKLPKLSQGTRCVCECCVYTRLTWQRNNANHSVSQCTAMSGYCDMSQETKQWSSDTHTYRHGHWTMQCWSIFTVSTF